MTIASALPFAVVLLVATYGLIKALRVDVVKRESLQMNMRPSTVGNPDESSWEKRLASILDHPDKKNVNDYINTVVKEAMEQVKKQLAKHDVEAGVEEVKSGRFILSVALEEAYDFHYEVRRYSYDRPAYGQDDDDDEAEDVYYRAEVHLKEGGQDYDIMGWPKEAVIHDIVEHYQKHMHFLHSIR